MAKQTNRVAWGLAALLAAVLVMAPVSYAAMFVRGAEWHQVRLLTPQEWAFGIGVTDNKDPCDPILMRWIDMGLITVERMDHIPRRAANPQTSTRSGTGR
jgi:hypothetical protein